MSSFTSRFSALLGVVSIGCGAMAGMVVGSSGWFEKQKPDVESKAIADLSCTAPQISYAPNGDDYREVEARGCGKKIKYVYVKVGPVGSWKGSAASPM